MTPSTPVPGSERSTAGAGPAVDTATVAEVTLVLRRQSPLPDGRRLTREELAAHGAAPADVRAVVQVAEQAGLEVLSTDAASRRVALRGPVGTLQEVFGTELQQVTSTDAQTGASVSHRARSGALSVPAELDGLVTAVLGLDDRPQARAQFHVAAPHTVSSSYTPLQLGEVYAFPPGTDGTGTTLAIVELGGGYTQADLDSYFSGLGLATPSVRAVAVDGGANAPEHDPSGADGEVLLDLEVAGALAPGADLVVYFAPNSDRGFVDAISDAVHADPTPAALSISWGQAEDQWTAQGRTAMDAAMADGAALGVTITVAAGDDGSSDRATDGGVHVDFPAASPHALACGGTALTLDSSGAVADEVVWGEQTHGATGGGVSSTFPQPSWQAGAGVPELGSSTGRGVPDVSAVADPVTGYQVLVDGQRTVIGGTSAVAPLWAALACRLSQALGRPLGLLQPALYATASPGVATAGFRDVTSGSNGAYSAGPGWDACTGLGVPVGTALLELLRSAPEPPATH